MAIRCGGRNAAGEPCQAWAITGSEYCYMHAPDKAAERAAARRRGGMRVRPPHAGDIQAIPAQVRTLADVLTILDYSLRETLALENSQGRARVLISLAEVFIKAIETGEIETRLEALEERINGLHTQN